MKALKILFSFFMKKKLIISLHNNEELGDCNFLGELFIHHKVLVERQKLQDILSNVQDIARASNGLRNCVYITPFHRKKELLLNMIPDDDLLVLIHKEGCNLIVTNKIYKKMTVLN